MDHGLQLQPRMSWTSSSIPFHVIGQDLRTHHVLPAVLAVLLAASTATFARTAQTRFWFTPNLAPYRTLIELIARGARKRRSRACSPSMPKWFTGSSKTSAARCSSPKTSDACVQVFSQVISEFRSRYLLTYTPTGVEQSGWHELDVRVRGRGRKVQARRGCLR